MAHGPAPHGSVQTDLGQIISSLPVSSLCAPSQCGVTALTAPFTTLKMSGEAFQLKCAETSWLE